jgi:hypothetical protein
MIGTLVYAVLLAGDPLLTSWWQADARMSSVQGTQVRFTTPSPHCLD